MQYPRDVGYHIRTIGYHKIILSRPNLVLYKSCFCKFLDNHDGSTVQICCHISSYTHTTIQWFEWWFSGPTVKEKNEKKMDCSSFIYSIVIMSDVKSAVLSFFFIFGSYTLNRRLRILWLAVFHISKKINDLDCGYGTHKISKK